MKVERPFRLSPDYIEPKIAKLTTYVQIFNKKFLAGFEPTTIRLTGGRLNHLTI